MNRRKKSFWLNPKVEKRKDWQPRFKDHWYSNECSSGKCMAGNDGIFWLIWFFSRCDSERIQISMIYTVCIASNWSMTGQTVNTDISIRSFPDEWLTIVIFEIGRRRFVRSSDSYHLFICSVMTNLPSWDVPSLSR